MNITLYKCETKYAEIRKNVDINRYNLMSMYQGNPMKSFVTDDNR